ncbi:OLC1v1003886C6 [Oldenlandia corymbosa var. corymbosa]|uniref:non-specific serine/threonine protein kinase n=1 Tax=Oldenlandia corymbosa var. corymbosa TaxID=529605 RepID=A0AAV1DAZ0_OLDCO|nr:OLC1v1003886C6 [Oldenlandia corymbosa var. corymbosa]
MKQLMERVLVCLLTLGWIEQCLSVVDGRSNSSETDPWTCTCFTSDQRNLSVAVPASCYASCDCNPATGGSSENSWTCGCLADGLPKVASGNNYTSCFTNCDCKSGTAIEMQSSRKQIRSKIIVIVLVICITLLTLAFIASLLCFIYRKHKWPIKRPLFFSDKETSWSSATSLISKGVIDKASAHAPILPISGCFPKVAFIFRNKTGTFKGMIIEFSYFELEMATNKFADSNLIGVGGSSQVYRGHLKDGKVVAIKRMKTLAGSDAESIFLKEIELIARLHHCHVVPLLGFCSIRQGKQAEWLLVFEFMSNGNLRECLDGASEKCLDWGTRVTIALGAARGLEYLHEAAAPRILHRDVKSTNVLLDENWRAKITDLGMAKHLQNDGIPSCPSSPARMQGTFGYFAPEYAIVGRASLKSDVFSFGVVLLELISGRKPIQTSDGKGEESLVIWATPRLQDSRRVISELPDPKLRGNFHVEEMQVMAYLAKECLLLDPESRPTMSEVVQVLSTITPETSRRKNMSVHLFQSSCSDIQESIDRLLLDPVEDEELKHMTLDGTSDEDSFVLNIRTNDCQKMNDKEVNSVSVDSMESLILLASNARSWRSQEDEAVDLTEPRFEKFCVSNVTAIS